MVPIVVHSIFVLIFIALLLFLSYFGADNFKSWEAKASLLSSSIILTLFIVFIISVVTGDELTFYDTYQSAPLIFEVLAPVSAVLILQNVLPKEISARRKRYDSSDLELLGFALACLFSVVIVATPQYLELPRSPGFESMLLYLAIVFWWVVHWDRYR
jgi:uncharacterized integral membrane protein